MKTSARKEIMPNVELTCITTEKFKTGFFSVNIIRQLRAEEASKNALIPAVLRCGCERLPDIETLSAELDELYGASISAQVRTKGEVQSIGFAAGFADDRLLPDEDRLPEKVIGLVGEILLNPVTEGGILKAEYVETEKENLRDRIRSALNDKRVYAATRMREIMCAEENYGVDRLGSVEAVEGINPRILTKHYRQILQTSEIQMFYCGSASPERIETAIKEAIELPAAEKPVDVSTEVRLNCLQTQYHMESLDVTQGKLCLGFRLGEIMADPDYAALSVFNAVYGGSVTSKLFTNVRERLSLCYYASSGYDKHKGIMTVSSGIEFEKYEEALGEILSQLTACAKGEITEDEIGAAKKYVSVSLRTMLDSPEQMENYWLGQAIEGMEFDLEQYAERVERVEKAQVVRIAESVVLDTVYFLNKTEEKAEEQK